MSFPWAFNSRALVAIAIVADSAKALILFESALIYTEF
jgi:hypothetical protein